MNVGGRLAQSHLGLRWPPSHLNTLSIIYTFAFNVFAVAGGQDKRNEWNRTEGDGERKRRLGVENETLIAGQHSLTVSRIITPPRLRQL